VTPMRVLDLSTCRLTGQPALLLADREGSRRLAFYLPLNEANRLSRALGMAGCACTPIFELTETPITALSARILRAELEGDEHGISGALVLARDGQEVHLPSHPADALALAIRAGAPSWRARARSPRPGPWIRRSAPTSCASGSSACGPPTSGWRSKAGPSGPSILKSVCNTSAPPV
jgi:bifunctional DNase/RNase